MFNNFQFSHLFFQRDRGRKYSGVGLGGEIGKKIAKPVRLQVNVKGKRRRRRGEEEWQCHRLKICRRNIVVDKLLNLWWLWQIRAVFVRIACDLLIHLIRLMRKHDLTDKETMDKNKERQPYLENASWHPTDVDWCWLMLTDMLLDKLLDADWFAIWCWLMLIDADWS